MTKKRGRRPLPETERKDRVVQTRIDEELSQTLQREAKRNRLTVSQLIRNVLEDTFDLVDHVVADAVQLGQTVKRDAKRIAESAQGQARRHADEAHGHRHADEEPRSRAADEGHARRSAGEGHARRAATDEGHARRAAGNEGHARGATATNARQTRRTAAADEVYAWQDVVLARDALCGRCGRPLKAGDEALVGLTDNPSAVRVWRCRACSSRK